MSPGAHSPILRTSFGGATFLPLRTSPGSGMRRLRYLLALLLLWMTGTMNLLGAHAPTGPRIHDEQPAGCHDHGKNVPARPPASYACCVAGHSSAVVQASCVLHPPLPASIALLLTGPPPPEAAPGSGQVLQVSLGAPPGASPLRI